LQGDHRVIFRVLAPKAQEVLLRGQWAKEEVALARGEDGVWSATVGPIAPGVWEYNFVVDGLTMVDPANPAIKPMRAPHTSILHISGTPPNPWDFQDVPHGVVHQHSYFSRVFRHARELWVYTPPGYETNTDAKYQLLVLQHGSGDNQQTWVVHGKAHWILDNLIAAGKARTMIVLMLDGHPPVRESAQNGGSREAAMGAFRHELFEDALPLVESDYRVERDAAHTAIAGLSMGGWQSLSVGLNNLDRFAWVGAFSALPPSDENVKPALDDATVTNRKLRLLWIAVGQDDFLRKHNEQFIATLDARGIHHEWRLTPGDHAWPVWRNYLVEFLPKLFHD
jgi:enterochelin esterase family protein